jgi:hypothetical protein
MLIGRVTRGGTTLSPLPLEVESLDTERSVSDAAQDASGGVHLLVGESNGEDRQYRYMQLTCDEVAP